MNHCKIFCCYRCQRQLLYKWRDQQQGCTLKSFKYDILDAIIALGTDSLLYQTWGFCVLHILSLINISFIRPHLDYGDAIFDQAYNKSFHESLESLQYNASLAITRAIGGTSKQKLYQDLGLKSLQHRRWFSKLCISY